MSEAGEKQSACDKRIHARRRRRAGGGVAKSQSGTFTAIWDFFGVGGRNHYCHEDWRLEVRTTERGRGGEKEADVIVTGLDCCGDANSVR